MLCYHYLLKMPLEWLKRAKKLYSATITEWLGFLRQLFGEAAPEEKMVIGGPGIVVKVNETMPAKRKYNRGRRVDGGWI